MACSNRSGVPTPTRWTFTSAIRAAVHCTFAALRRPIRPRRIGARTSLAIIARSWAWAVPRWSSVRGVRKPGAEATGPVADLVQIHVVNAGLGVAKGSSWGFDSPAVKIGNPAALEKPQNRYQRSAFARPQWCPLVDTSCMNSNTRQLLLRFALMAGFSAGGVFSQAADGCRHCVNQGALSGGQKTACGETGCGPRYWGAFWDEPNCPDPCDCRNQWRGGQFKSPSLDLLARWQLPPGKGFRSPEQCGYATEGHCHSCGHGWWPHWLTPGGWFH